MEHLIILDRIGKSEREIYKDFHDSGLKVTVSIKNEFKDYFEDRFVDFFNEYKIVDAIENYDNFQIIMRGQVKNYIPVWIKLVYDKDDVNTALITQI